MMLTFKAIEIQTDSARPTGKIELYLARGKKEAASKLLYTRRLKNRNCKLGPTGLVVSCGTTAWVLTSSRRIRKASR